MKLNDVVTFALFVTLNVSATVGLAAELESPMIKGHGSTVEIPNGKYPPQANARVVLDVTSGERTGGVLKALDKAALIINLYSDAKAGVDQGFKMVIVLHGSATSAALTDEAFVRRDVKPSSTPEKTDHNPDAKLIGELHKAGVQIVVCGQSLARNGYPVDEVMSEVEVAVSATVTNITLQNQDYAYLPFH